MRLLAIIAQVVALMFSVDVLALLPQCVVSVWPQHMHVVVEVVAVFWHIQDVIAGPAGVGKLGGQL